ILARLRTVARVAVGAGGPVRHHHMGAVAGRIVARVRRAGIAVIAVLAGARHALPGYAHARRAAGPGPGAGGSVGHRRKHAALGRIAGIARARVVVVAGERRAWRAHTGAAHLGAIARVAVGAGRPIRDRRVDALELRRRIARIHRARIVVVAARWALLLRLAPFRETAGNRKVARQQPDQRAAVEVHREDVLVYSGAEA